MTLTRLSQHGPMFDWDPDWVEATFLTSSQSIYNQCLIAIWRKCSNRSWRLNRHNNQSPVSVSLSHRILKPKVCTVLCFSYQCTMGTTQCSHLYWHLRDFDTLILMRYQTIHLLLVKLYFHNLMQHHTGCWLVSCYVFQKTDTFWTLQTSTNAVPIRIFIVSPAYFYNISELVHCSQTSKNIMFSNVVLKCQRTLAD